MRRVPAVPETALPRCHVPAGTEVPPSGSMPSSCLPAARYESQVRGGGADEPECASVPRPPVIQWFRKGLNILCHYLLFALMIINLSKN